MFLIYVPRSRSHQGQEFRTYGKLSRLLNNLTTSLPITPKLAWLADAYWKWKTVYHNFLCRTIMDLLHFARRNCWVIELQKPFPWQRPTWPTLHPLDSYSSDSWLSNGTKFVLIAWGAHENPILGVWRLDHYISLDLMVETMWFFCKDLTIIISYVLSKNEYLAIFHFEINQNFSYFQILHFWLGWIGTALLAMQNPLLGSDFYYCIFPHCPMNKSNKINHHNYDYNN